MNPHTNSEPLAFKIKRAKFTGPNPFTCSQARDYPTQKISTEFFPTSKYWSRFNVSNEILIGTRGSGKTILLKMLTYSAISSLLKGPSGEQLRAHLETKGLQFIGFYVPLRLRVLREIGATDDPEIERQRFSFLFNCASAGSIIEELVTIVRDLPEEKSVKLLRERHLIDKLKKTWRIDNSVATATLQDLKDQIDEIYESVRLDWSMEDSGSTFGSALLEPIISVIPSIENALGLESEKTSWIACFDEAEYLNQNLQRVLNTVMRSESRGLAIKIATLPFHYKEFETEVDGEFIQPEGDDFRFENIDYDWEDNDFKELTNRLVAMRLSETGLFDEFPGENALNKFVGENTDKDLADIYKSTNDNTNDEKLDRALVGELEVRKSNQSSDYSEGQIKRYMPIFLLKELHKLSKQGNTKVPWLSGPRMVRRVSDGNVRRFIQLCDIIFEKSRKQFLRPKPLHDAVYSFAKQRFARAESVYEEGFLLHQFLESVSSFLHEKLHSGPLLDVGVGFRVADEFLSQNKVHRAIEMGVAYSYIACPEPDLFNGVTSETQLRLANCIAALKWLPMRAGTGIQISARSEIRKILEEGEFLPPQSSAGVFQNLELDLSGG